MDPLPTAVVPPDASVTSLAVRDTTCTKPWVLRGYVIIPLPAVGAVAGCSYIPTSYSCAVLGLGMRSDVRRLGVLPMSTQGASSALGRTGDANAGAAMATSSHFPVVLQIPTPVWGCWAFSDSVISISTSTNVVRPASLTRTPPRTSYTHDIPMASPARLV